MATSIFRVDLSEGAPDFQPTATEPGLGMLDRQNANYVLLRHWLGDMIAEPEWRPDESVHFYINEEKRGRLTDVVCQPATKADLEGPLKDDLELLKTRLSKVRPESTTEQSLLRIARQTVKQLTDDLDLSEHDCYLFKYREEKQPWRLLWCWGYQRADLQPATAVICHNIECNQLYVHRPKTKNLCPGCQKPTVRKRKRGLLASPWLAAALLLLLLALVSTFALLNPPRLVVTPLEWKGLPGSRVEFSAIDQRWYFFKTDVTNRVVPQSHDTRVIEFAPAGCIGRAKNVGLASVTFRYQNLETSVPITVGRDDPPDSITIEPATVALGIGSTAKLKAMGHYAEGPPIDITDIVLWEAIDASITFAHDGIWEGLGAGETQVTASFFAIDADEPLTASADVSVAQVDYTALEVMLDPLTIAVGQGGEMEINALDAAGTKYSMLRSSWLSDRIDPASNATIEEDFVIGRSAGPSELVAAVSSPDGAITLEEKCAFMVTGESLLAGVFTVEPDEAALVVDEVLPLDVISDPNEDMTWESSNPDVVDVVERTKLKGTGIGEAEVTFTQGDTTHVVKVSVSQATFASLRIAPDLASLRVGEERTLSVFGVGDDGNEFELLPSDVTWIKHPVADYFAFDPQTLELRGISPTPVGGINVICSFRDQLRASAILEVTGEQVAVSGLDALEQQGWDFYPQIPFHGRRVAIPENIAADGFYDRDRGYRPEGIVSTGPLAMLPGDSIITSLDGESILGLEPDVVSARLARIGEDTIIGYLGADGVARRISAADVGLVILPVELAQAQPTSFGDGSLSARLRLHLRPQADYRITDAAGNPLTDWSAYGPNQTVEMDVSGIPQAAGDDPYEVYVEWKRGDAAPKKTLQQFRLGGAGPVGPSVGPPLDTPLEPPVDPLTDPTTDPTTDPPAEPPLTTTDP